MTTAIQAGNQVFYDRNQILDYLVDRVERNINKQAGTEWECILTGSANGQPIRREDGQRFFNGCAQLLGMDGIHVRHISQETDVGRRDVALEIPGYGTLSQEGGGQIEFACSVSKTPEEILDKNKFGFNLINRAAKSIGYSVQFKGYIPGYSRDADPVLSSRWAQWKFYYEKRFRNGTLAKVRDGQYATASTQATLDSGAKNFHEYFSALLLIEPLLTIKHSNSNRSQVILGGYGSVIPTQIDPISKVWGTKSAREALDIILDRVLQLEVPFIPDAQSPGMYVPQNFVSDPNDPDNREKERPPTVQEMLDNGGLREAELACACSFLYSRPAFRTPARGLIEVRGVDSLSSPEAVNDFVHFVLGAVYDTGVRRDILNSYADFTPDDIDALHAAVSQPKHKALATVIKGRTVASMIHDIEARVATVDFDELWRDMDERNEAAAAKEPLPPPSGRNGKRLARGAVAEVTHGAGREVGASPAVLEAERRGARVAAVAKAPNPV